MLSVKDNFICPNCGSTEPGYEEYVSKENPDPKDINPWSSVLLLNIL